MESTPLLRKKIRSFVLRTSRLTDAQSRALESLWPTLGWDAEQPLQQQELFGRQAPLWLEIGIGNGDALVYAAKQNPDVDFIGIEVHTPGVGHCLRLIEKEGLRNVRVCRRDAVEVLAQMIPASSLAQVNLFFPDPWHKKRHHKRRIVNDEFCKLTAAALKPNGLLHMATDWEDYAQWMQETLARHDTAFALQPDCLSQRPLWRPQTRFERRGLGLGHSIVDLLYHRC